MNTREYMSNTRRNMLAYLAGKLAWERQIPRNAVPRDYDHEQRRKWCDGWDVAMGISLAVEGERRKKGERLSL